MELIDCIIMFNLFISFILAIGLVNLYGKLTLMFELFKKISLLEQLVKTNKSKKSGVPMVFGSGQNPPNVQPPTKNPLVV